ncbi:hypothetical protein PtB15_6B1 [Puccinia triticina]|nr:hypothetical protein PtB15_6B1 [Puccinia triticina]
MIVRCCGLLHARGELRRGGQLESLAKASADGCTTTLDANRPVPSNSSPRLYQMDNAGSADLQWLLLRGWNSKVVKRGSAGFMFSSEAGNLKNTHSPRYSGLVHPKPMGVTAAPSGGVLITTRKASANPRQVKAARTTVRVNGSMAGSRRAAGKAAKAAKNYRSDLARAAILRAARIAQTNVRSKKPKSA